MLVDTGATYTCIGLKDASHLPMSDKSVKTVGFSGKLQTVPMTDPVQLTMENETVTLLILVSDQTPINLLGRDALCKLNVNIFCTHEGVELEN